MLTIYSVNLHENPAVDYLLTLHDSYAFNAEGQKWFTKEVFNQLSKMRIKVHTCVTFCDDGNCTEFGIKKEPLL